MKNALPLMKIHHIGLKTDQSVYIKKKGLEKLKILETIQYETRQKKTLEKN